jgi:hypothetical protein
MFCAFVGKGLETSFNEANNVVIVTVTWISMMNVKSLQKPHIKLGIMPDFGPFLHWHDASRVPFSKQG